jgi:2-isopropylmalate synthase
MSERQTPEYVHIFDTTLRDGAQSPGIALSTEQSLDIARQLSRLGVDVIEAGFPNSSPENFEAVQRIAQEVEGPVIAGLARAESPDIEAAAEAVKDAERPRIHTFISTSDIHIADQMPDGTTREDVKGMARAAVAQAKHYVEDVEFSPMDATRADVEFTAEVVQIALDEGATTINIPDTVGYTQPDEFKEYIRKLYEYAPALGGVVLSVHCHDDLGLAVANSFAGIQAGARQVECAVNGLGERAGNASLEEIIMLLRTRRDSDGFDTGINTEMLGPTSRMVSRYTGYAVQHNKAIIGRNAFQHESGIHQAGVLNNPLTFEIMNPEDVGMEAGIVLGKQSGRKALKHILDREGVFKGEHLDSTFKLFKELADRVGGISVEQAVELHEEAQRRHANPFKLEDYDVTASGKGVYGAGITIIAENGQTLRSSAQNDLEHPTVDGSTSALFSALQGALDQEIEFRNFELDSIGEGEQTVGKATVTLQINGETFTGHGLAFDTLKASGWAYLDAYRKSLAAA